MSLNVLGNNFSLSIKEMLYLGLPELPVLLKNRQRSEP